MLIINIIIFSLLILAWLLPNHYLPWLSAYQEFCMFLVALFFSFLLIFKNKIYVPKIAYGIFLIVLIPIIQVFLGIIYNLGDALLVSMYIGFFLITFISGYSVSKLKDDNKSKILNFFLISFLFSSIISVGLQLNQWLLLEGNIWIVDLAPNARPFANVAQPNLLSTLLITGLFAVFHLYENNKIRSFSASLAIAFILFGIALTFSRTAWVFYFIFIIFYFFKKNTIKDKFYFKPLSLFIWSGILFIYLLLIPFLSEKLGLIYEVDLNRRATKGMERLNMWSQLLDIIQQQPFLGYGWNQLNIAQMSAENINSNYPVFGYSHNFILDFLIWNGVFIGIILVCVISYFYINLALRINQKCDVILLGIIGIIALHSMLEYPFAYSYFLIPLAFFTGIIYGNYYFYPIATKKSNFFYSFLTIALTCMLLLTTYEYIKINPDYQAMRYENVQLKNRESNQEEQRYFMLKSINDYIWFVRYPLQQDMSSNDLWRARQVVFSKPEKPALVHYIKILVMNNRFDEAQYVINKYNAFYRAELKINDLKLDISNKR
ncbi:hypothetical protein CU318_08945 [Acinetobacter pseudolwoffii]|nr:hypothetical protein CU318_08945 [Acinetobacter pseudolwoffii]